MLSSEKFLPILLALLTANIEKGTGALIISAILDFLAYALCAPYSETTDGEHFDFILSLVAKSGRCLFRLFSHKSFSIVKATCLLIKAIIEEGTAQVSKHLQQLSLAEGTFLFHLHSALYPLDPDPNLYQIQILSRKLLTLWTVNHETSNRLLEAIFPVGLLNFLESKEKPPYDSLNVQRLRNNLKMAQENMNKPVSSLQKLRDIHPSVRAIERNIENTFNHWRKKIGLINNEDLIDLKNPIVLRRRREFVKSTLNWNMFFYQFYQNHALPDLIWNYKTREELREALEEEINHFKSDKVLYSHQLISWNFAEFEVKYPSLNEEIKIGDFYLRLLLTQENQTAGGGAAGSGDQGNKLTNKLFIKNADYFFNSLYHKFLSNNRIEMKSDCLQAMAIIYDNYHEEIREFDDVEFLVSLLLTTRHRLLRDRIIKFFHVLIKDKVHIKKLIHSNAIPILIDFTALSHLHVNRAVIHTQTNVIEASAGQLTGAMEKEWHVSENQTDKPFSLADLKEMWEAGQINEDTKCWAQGYNSWNKLSDIVQLKWTFLGQGASIFRENDMTVLIIDILIRMSEAYPSRSTDDSIIRPISKIKQILSNDHYLPHLVHLLLTFDPTVVEKVATLLCLIMQDNPRITLLYQTGLFYFIMMYTGSNIAPISRLLHLTHMKQSFKSEENVTNLSVLQKSILSQILPEAMVCFLENYGPEHFSKVFLGEYDTPEVIWNNEMRRFMIERIAAHIADFSPRLQSNVRVFYQYCPIPSIRYSQLENELFCNIYYLKNLCDSTRFGDWKIKDPVALLKDILEMWKMEIAKKPNLMEVEDALEILTIKDYDGPITGQQFESLIRKCYYTQAQKYHPDKNPAGREMFEKVNNAYYFLCSGDSKRSNGPDVQNIVLLLKTQSILFARHNVELYQYKYAGYPMLLQTLQLEHNDQYLFSKTNPLLGHACKVVYYSIKCSALNAEELRREQGLQILYEILNRCVTMLSASSSPKDLATKVCRYIISSFGVGAEFPACRKMYYEMSMLSKNIFYLLNYKQLNKLVMAALDAIIYFCSDPYLQWTMFQAGIVFSLLQFIFKYDYTMEEVMVSDGDTDVNEKNNKQFVHNLIAKKSLCACVALFEDRFAQADIEDASQLDDYARIRQSLFALLTPYIAKQLTMDGVSEVLKMLNSNMENPYFIWNNQTRAELVAYLQEQEKELLRSGHTLDESYGGQFVYSCHKEELIIGDIFVRIYNEQPNYPIVDIRKFVFALLDSLGSHAQYLHSLQVLSFPKVPNVVVDEARLANIKQCLTALINLVQHNAGLEPYFIGCFRTMFSFLRWTEEKSVQTMALQFIMTLSTNKECINDIAQSNVLFYMLLMMVVDRKINESSSRMYLNLLDTLISFTSNSDIVKEGMAKGLLPFALNLYIVQHNFAVREKSIQLLAKMSNDKQNGQHVTWLLSQYLPNLFLNAMRDAPQNAVNLFDQNQENPELIWTDEHRSKLCAHMEQLVQSIHSHLVQDPSFTWKYQSANGPSVSLAVDKQEFQIAGVYLRIYNQNPGWVLSRPKDFLFGLLENVKDTAEQSQVDVSVVCLENVFV